MSRDHVHPPVSVTSPLAVCRLVHEWADVTAVFGGKPGGKQSILGKASLGLWAFRGEHRECDRRDDRRYSENQQDMEQVKDADSQGES
jgi:hypothetical protein